MRAVLYVLVMIMGACTGESSKSSLDEYDGGPLDQDSEVQSTDTESTHDSEKDSEEGSDTDVQDSDTQDSDTQDSDTQDTDTSDTETSEPDTGTEEPEPESCVFSEKGTYKCEGNTLMECKEDPNSSTIELIWQEYYECPLETECAISYEYPMYPEGVPTCNLIGECMLGTTQCSEDQAQILECVLDEETGGGYWEVKEECADQDLQCWTRTADGELRCVPNDWVYCKMHLRPGDMDCVDNQIMKCTENWNWEVLKNCTDDGQICGNNDGDWICFEPCEYQCTSNIHMTCEDYRGTVVYNAGQCLNGWECCKIPPKT